MKLFVLFAVTAGLFGQTFDVASVRVNPGGGESKEGPRESMVSSPGTLTFRNVTLRSCVVWAYDVRDFQISGGPGWLSSTRYDINAKAGAPVGDPGLRKMLRALLADRFHLQLHQEMRQLPVYALIPAKNGTKLKPAAGHEAGDMKVGAGTLDFHNVTMPEFAERLSVRPLAVDRPVLDQTGMSGGYDFSLRFADNIGSLKGALEDIDRNGGISLFAVIQDQMGVKLDPRKMPLPALVIERADENPSGN